MHGILFFGNMKNQIRLKNKISFAISDISTYSACVVNSVMHFWVCEYHETGPPAHITTPRTPTYGQSPCSRSQHPQMKPNETLLLPPLKCIPKTTGPFCIPQNKKCRFPVDHLRCTAIPCYCPHCIRDIRAGQQGNSQKRTDHLSKREENNRLVNI